MIGVGERNMGWTNRPLTSEAAKKLMALGLQDKETLTYEKLDEWYTAWGGQCNDDLDILIFHSDCGGKFTPQECRKIYNAMKNLTSDLEGHNYGVMKPYNMFEHWKAIFKHCADRRVNLYYL